MRPRHRRRWRGWLVAGLLVLVVAGLLVLLDITRAGLGGFSPAAPAPAPRGTDQAQTGLGPSPIPDVVQSGLDTFVTAAGTGPVVGRSGEVHRYRVEVENGLGLDAATFAAGVDAILDDPRSWTAGGTVRFQRVPAGSPAEFTVYLASPVTAEAICKEGYLEIDQYTNCRLSGKVVINSARWLTAVPDYGAPLSVYRGYAVNHEVGHQLGYGHELCPGPGRPAPVMQQQTLGLHGCLANSWPYLGGVHYQGQPAPE